MSPTSRHAETTNIALLNTGIAQAKAVAERAHKLLVNLGPCPQHDELKELRDLVATVTQSFIELGYCDEEHLPKLLTGLTQSPQVAAISTEVLEAWVEKLHALGAILRRALLHVTLTRRLKEPQRAAAPQRTPLGKEEIAELKELNAKLIFAQIALGEDHVEAVGLRLNLDPTSVCNVRCVTCYQNYSETFEPHVIPVEALEKAFEALLFFQGLDIFGLGEPTLSKQLPVIIDQVERSQVRANLLTNGTLLDRRWLPLDKLHSLTVSWDGARAETLEKIRLGVSFDGTLNRLREVRARFPALSLAFNVTINRANIDEISEIVELAASLGMQSVNFTRMYGQSHLDPLCLTVSDIDELEKQFAIAREIGQSRGVHVSSAIHYDGLKPAGPPVKKREILQQFVDRPSVNRKTGDSIKTLRDELLAVGEVGVPFELPAWVTQLPKNSEAKWEFVFDVAALREKVDRKLQRIRETPTKRLAVPFCMSPWVHNFASASGGLRPCCLITSDYGDLTKPGSMLHQLNTAKFTNLRRGLLQKAPHPQPCRGCTFIERYHSIPEYFDFLESLGKNPEELRLPPEFNPGPNIKIRSRKSSLTVSQVTWRELALDGLSSSVPNLTFAEAVAAKRLKASDCAYLESSGRWFRAAWMAEPDKTITIATCKGPDALKEEEDNGRGLANHLWQRLGKVQPCSTQQATITVEPGGRICADVSLVNDSDQWLWGFGARADGHDAIGFRFHHSDGAFSGEARLYFSNECIPPRGERRVMGGLNMSTEDLRRGRHRVEVDVVRELMNWSLPEERRLIVEFEL